MVKEHWIETPQGDIFAARWEAVDAPGERTPIVLFHDSLGCVALWRDFPARLSQATGRDVVAYDRLGFGRSDAYRGRLPVSFVSDEATGTFAAVRNHLELEHFVLFGHSVGGGMAVITAAQYPDKCQALITESAQAFVEDRTLRGILDAKRSFSDSRQVARLKKYHGAKTEWVLSAWIDTWLSDAFQSWSLDAALPGVRCRSLAIHGELDEYGSQLHPERIASIASGPASVQIIPNCRHVPHRECEDVVIRSVEALLCREA